MIHATRFHLEVAFYNLNLREQRRSALCALLFHNNLILPFPAVIISKTTDKERESNQIPYKFLPIFVNAYRFMQAYLHIAANSHTLDAKSSIVRHVLNICFHL
jgi:uncharacterized protein YdeI (YjbR/CyaY-like superfamily)